MDNEDTIQFDPGYAPIVTESIGQVGYIYYMFNAVNNVKIKRQNFFAVSIKLEKLLKENIAFYLGCLLWASYISQFDKKITGNKLLGEEASEEEYTSEINFLLDFVENKYPRDYKYYKNKNYIPDEKYIPILRAYKDFLILNNGFVDCSKTCQIIMPEYFKKPDGSELDLIYKEIQNAIKIKNLEGLFNCYDLIF